MHLTRREFAAATAGGLSLFVWDAAGAAVGVEPVRHAHVELPSGPYTREALSRIVAQAARAAGYAEALAMSAIGTRVDAEMYPPAFALTLSFPDNRMLVVRASQRHAGAPVLTLRGQHASVELRYSDTGEAFRS